MKLFTILLSFSLSFGVYSADSSCLKMIKKAYRPASDTRVNYELVRVLAIGESVEAFKGETFLEDKLIFQVSGSYHSGYFADYLLVSKDSCQIEKIVNVYSE